MFCCIYDLIGFPYERIVMTPELLEICRRRRRSRKTGILSCGSAMKQHYVGAAVKLHHLEECTLSSEVTHTVTVPFIKGYHHLVKAFRSGLEPVCRYGCPGLFLKHLVTGNQCCQCSCHYEYCLFHDRHQLKSYVYTEQPLPCFRI